MSARSSLFAPRIDLDALRGVGTSLPVVTVDGLDAVTTDRAQRRTMLAAGEVLGALRSLSVSGQAHLRALGPLPADPAPVIDTAVQVRVDLGDGDALLVFPHRAGGTAAVAFEETPHRCWVIDLDDLAAAATTLLTMTAERLGDAAWATRHGIPATAVRLVPGVDSQWQLAVVDGDRLVVAEPNGTLVRASVRGARLSPADVQVPSEEALARTAADLTREAAMLLAA